MCHANLTSFVPLWSKWAAWQGHKVNVIGISSSHPAT